MARVSGCDKGGYSAGSIILILATSKVVLHSHVADARLASAVRALAAAFRSPAR
jgi:hypothetical protein